jgi:hemerythrin-like metal-binding protein
MAFYEWTARLSVGISSIDRQHKTLIGYINTLAEAINKDNSQVVVGIVLGNLVSYTKMHFIYEEMLFDRYGYQETQAHKALHKKLTAQVDEYYTRFKKGDTSFSADLLEFLMDWLNHHILIEDVAYSAFLTQHGVS